MIELSAPDLVCIDTWPIPLRLAFFVGGCVGIFGVAAIAKRRDQTRQQQEEGVDHE